MKTKIVVTVGPRTEGKKELLSLIEAGADMIRVNFSHATYEQYERIKKIIDDCNKKRKEDKVALMLDLQGPRIRVGKIPGNGIMLHVDEVHRFVYSKATYQSGGIIPIDNCDLHKYIKKGEPLFLCNGAIELVVLEVKDEVITAKVINNGVLSSNKGINVPNTNIKKGGITVKDKKDIKFGLKAGMDYIALSFVQTAEDVKELRRLLGAKSKVKIISKIERGIALKNIDGIIQASDAIMVARGDLGIEVPIEELPVIQKNLIRHAHWHEKPAILATQVMTSMIKNPHPTRAEVSDIANAVFDRADMVMLSDETAVGDHPIEAVKIMSKIIKKTAEYFHRNYITN